MPYDQGHSLIIGNEVIKQEECVKFLGMYIDSELKWSKHLQHCKAKIAGSLYIINRAKKLLTTEHLRTLYHALIYPYLDYGIMLWGSTNKKYLQPLIKQQKNLLEL